MSPIELKTYDLRIAEIIVILRCIQDHGHLGRSGWKTIIKKLGISRAGFYRKIKLFDNQKIIDELIDLGYTLSFVKKITSIK